MTCYKKTVILIVTCNYIIKFNNKRQFSFRHIYYRKDFLVCVSTKNLADLFPFVFSFDIL